MLRRICVSFLLCPWSLGEARSLRGRFGSFVAVVKDFLDFLNSGFSHARLVICVCLTEETLADLRRELRSIHLGRGKTLIGSLVKLDDWILQATLTRHNGNYNSFQKISQPFSTEGP